MKTIEGYDVKIFTDNVEESAIDQIKELLKVPGFGNLKIRCMPDIHSGKGCVIGFTSNYTDRIIVNVIGVDISCEMLTTKIKEGDIDVEKLDKVIHEFIPSGRDVHKDNTYLNRWFPDEYREGKRLIEEMRCYRELKDTRRLFKALGTLGGGNHFIELNKSEKDNSYYLVIHSGSRNLGKQVADYYQTLAWKNHNGWKDLMAKQNEIIKTYKEQGRRTEINDVLKKLHAEFQCDGKKSKLSRDLCYIDGEDMQDYLHDSKLCGQWSSLSKKLMRDIIFKEMGWTPGDSFETIHNYIDQDMGIIRKGSVSAKEGEILLIPMNMRDGSLICRGKGNPDWNYSAPHGAGRIMSRAQAFKTLKMEDFRESMKGIYTTSVTSDTLDEAPMVYKPMQEIIDNIQETVEVLEVIKPVYNFKASERPKGAEVECEEDNGE